MAYQRPQPPAIRQNNLWWCWAACLEILVAAQPGKFPSPPLPRTQEQWLSALRSSPAGSRVLNEQGGIRMQSFPEVVSQIGMRVHSWAGPPNSRADIDFIEQQLRLSYLLAVRTVSGGSHFVVIYGVTPTHLYYFNPAPGSGYAKITHAEIQAQPLVISWKP